MPATPPKVFVSHASEDKERFVVNFAQRLRANGVDAWLDQWEMGPGDSLVDKIFEQGLKEAQAVIIVISQTSVHKPWVREELNLAVVKRVATGIKLIPVVIDQCEVPQSLQSTLWQRIDDLDHYDAAFERILAAIFDASTKPPIGAAPERLQTSPKIPTLTQADDLVLQTVAQLSIAQRANAISIGELRDALAPEQLSDTALEESLDILRQKNALQIDWLAPLTGSVILTLVGFGQYAEHYIENYTQLLQRIGGLIVNSDVASNDELAEKASIPLGLVNFLLDVFAEAGHLTLAKYGSGTWEVVQYHPSLKRLL
jgi:hypothetical protein